MLRTAELIVKIISQHGGFFEIYLNTPLEVCEQRDVKGLYTSARENIIQHFTGISDPYEEPRSPELAINTDIDSINESVDKIITKLTEFWLFISIPLLIRFHLLPNPIHIFPSCLPTIISIRG